MRQIRKYAKSRALKLTTRLGHGQDGLVWRTSHTAVKCFEKKLNYERELQCYQHLADMEINRIGDFNVPRLMGNDDDLFIVEMDFVNPPRILDFGKAYVKLHPLDRPHPYSDEELERFFDDCVEKHWSDADWPLVRWVYNQLDAHGICYLDIKPGNIDLGHLSHDSK